MDSFNTYNFYDQSNGYPYANDYYALQHHYNQLLQTTMYNPTSVLATDNTGYTNSLTSDDAAKSNTKVSMSPVSNHSSDLNYTPLVNHTDVQRYYTTPPSDESFFRSRQDQEQKSSPEVSPLDDSLTEYTNTSKVKRRTRTQFTKYQIDCLDAVFNKNHYPDVQTVDRLSESLNLAIERISVWFQNRRAKFKKTKKPMKSSSNQPSSSNAIKMSTSKADSYGINTANNSYMQNAQFFNYQNSNQFGPLSTNSESTSAYGRI